MRDKFNLDEACNIGAIWRAHKLVKNNKEI